MDLSPRVLQELAPSVPTLQQNRFFPILDEAPASQGPAGRGTGPTPSQTALFLIEFLPGAGPRSITRPWGKWSLNGNFWLLFACQCGWAGGRGGLEGCFPFVLQSHWAAIFRLVSNFPGLINELKFSLTSTPNSLGSSAWSPGGRKKKNK